MKHLLYIFFTLLFLGGYSQTQSEMNSEANKSSVNEYQNLDGIYNTIIAENKEDTVFIKNLILSQQIWSSYRDAQLKVKFPDREPGYYGSVHPMCVATYLEQLTNDRIETLKEWVKGTIEGDVCSGSVKFK